MSLLHLTSFKRNLSKIFTYVNTYTNFLFKKMFMDSNYSEFLYNTPAYFLCRQCNFMKINKLKIVCHF